LNIDMETMVLRSFFTNDEFMRKVVPFMEPAYFSDAINKTMFKQFVKYVAKYNKPPSQDSFVISLQDEESGLTDERYQRSIAILPDLFAEDKETDLEWLLTNTEKWCQDRALFNAVLESITIIDGKHDTLTKTALPDILSKALGVTFDNNVGHDYLTSSESRYDFYHRVEERIPFDIDMLNTITKGGLKNKSLNIILAGTGAGKSLFMCHAAAAAMSAGKNVLYITLEMSEESIAERIDANLLDTPIDMIQNLSKDVYTSKIDKIAAKTHGKLIIKEYPTAQAHCGHFRALMNELKLKKKFTADIVFIDYLNICSSSRMKVGGNVNTYSYIKAIAEEMRGLAVENNIPIMSATQTTRSGYGSSDPGLEDTSESFGLPATADLMLALIANDELTALNQVMVKQLKNRYADPNNNKRFVMGVDRSKMRLYNVENADIGLVNDVPQQQDRVTAFDNTPTGKRISTEGFKM